MTEISEYECERLLNHLCENLKYNRKMFATHLAKELNKDKEESTSNIGFFHPDAEIYIKIKRRK